MEIKLNDQEIEILRTLFKAQTIKKRTGELGIIHGMERFISTQVALKKPHLQTLDQIAQKIGLNGGINKTDK